MKLWPIEKYAIETALSPAEVLTRLQRMTTPGNSRRQAAIGGFFEGRLTDSKVGLRQVLYSDASFMPEMYGSIEPRPGGATVRVEMVPGRATLTILAALAAFMIALIYEQNTLRVLLTTGGFALAGWVTALTGFWLDGGRARQKLNTALSPSVKPEDA